MKLLFFESYTDVVHGNSKNIFLLGSGMQAKGHKVNYLLTNDGPLSEHLESKNMLVKIIKYPDTLNTFGRKILSKNLLLIFCHLLVYNMRVIKYLRLSKPDIIHCTSTRSVISCGLAAIFCRIKLVWVIQMEHSNYFLDFLASILSSRLIFIAKKLRDDKPKFFRTYIKSKSEIIPIGIDLEEENQKINYSDIEKEGLKILCIASIVPDKGLHILLKDVIRLVNSGKNVYCYSIGQVVPGFENYKNDLKEMIDRANLSERVFFIGWVDNIKEWIPKYDIFILPSTSEGLSRALIESMYVGLPAIVTDTGALSEIVDNNVGRLISKDKEDALYEAIEFYINNSNFIKKHGKEARRRVKDSFTLDSYLMKMDNLYANISRF